METPETLPGGSKFFFGVALPLPLLFLCQAALLWSLDGSGSWDGMGLVIGTVVAIPGLLLANCWILPLRWTSRWAVFLAGLALPAVLVLTGYLWLYGGAARRVINGAFVSPFIGVWLFALAFFVPLVAALLYARKARRA
jgi:hypothetical protein